jgi:hypothetical protein
VGIPPIGAGLRGRWSGLRFLPGPWRWMNVVYQTVEVGDRTVIVTIQDGRPSRFAS